MPKKISHYLDFVRPKFFRSICQNIWSYCFWISLLLLGIGIVWGIFLSPADYQHGDTVRIMYVHVPASWWALGIYTGMAICGAFGLIFRNSLFLLIAKSFAPIGAGYTLISLVTGSLWGKLAWGAWWVWDARLTSMLILFFMYLGYINLAFTQKNRHLPMASILIIIGGINVPIIKWSVEWWSTLHQPASIIRLSHSAIHSSFLWPLLIMAVGFALFAFAMACLQLSNELALQKFQSKMIKELQ